MVFPDTHSEIEEISYHTVQFYESDDFLAEQVSAFIGAGLRGGEHCVIIATAAHREQIARWLQDAGTDVASARRQRRYSALDAAEALTWFMVDGMPDAGRFNTTIGGVVTNVAQGQPARHLRIFGEMVALLWAEGNSIGALALEDLWNSLIERLSASSPALLCA